MQLPKTINYAVILGITHNYASFDGSFMNAFEYFYTCYEQNKDVKLIFCSYVNNHIDNINFIKDKFIINEECLDNIYTIYNLKELYFINFKNILIISYPSERIINSILKYNKILQLSGSKEYYKKVTRFYCEYPHLTPDRGSIIKYKSKLRWDLIKIPDIKDNKVFINQFYDIKHRDKSHYLNLITNFNINDNIINKIKENKFITREDLNTPFNLDKFDSMVYIQNGVDVDRKPRCFIECQLMDKPYEFIFKGLKDGAYYRYYESLEESVYDRLLDINDPLIQDFLN